ncbi:TetR/AcrR family transcriptional regulator [Tsukamurella sp. 8F]|uniref:TetR/AcrR family transcriptional regulator n=1 Tax=unclassified Tsukamurella TaxID=2633480 RepID=UPI0023BA10F7|nr:MULTISPECIES: TetR/AcrR family transcriptional regulator [unclassified Tsukamurella]MDF0529342.1 TetR/AcrR family transcriptional regulator [Tsukamurella sp. 8J]MDF0587151.1 TetR/AcrR family transcriptional regulator [Tsukamurella sp. 8F]
MGESTAATVGTTPDGSGQHGDAVPSLADVTMLRELPATKRGIRTRDGIIAAARKVFEDRGFIDARLADIFAEAGCSTGTFYLYFGSKEEVLHAVLDTVRDDMLHPRLDEHIPSADPYAVIEASIHAYLVAYRRNASMMRLLEQVSTIDAGLRARRIARSKAFAQRNARGIERLQQRGLADPGLDPYLTACALSSMVSRLAYHTYCMTVGTESVVSDDEVPAEVLTQICSRLWIKSLDIHRG